MNYQNLTFDHSILFPGMVYMWPIFKKISAIAKRQLFYAMPFGFTAWLCGTRFIDRSNPQKAKDSMTSALDYCNDNKVWKPTLSIKILSKSMSFFRLNYGYFLKVQEI